MSYPSEKRMFAKAALLALLFFVTTFLLSINYWTVTGENTELREIIRSLRDDLDESIMVGRKRSEELSSVNAQLRSAKADNERNGEELKRLNEDIGMKKKLHGQLDEEFQEQLKKLEELQRLYKDKDIKNNELQQATSLLQKDNSLKQQRISELESRISTKEAEYNQLYSQYQHEQSKAQKKTEELERELQRTHELIDSINKLKTEKRVAAEPPKVNPQRAVPVAALLQEKAEPGMLDLLKNPQLAAPIVEP